MTFTMNWNLSSQIRREENAADSARINAMELGENDSEQDNIQIHTYIYRYLKSHSFLIFRRR